MRAKSSSQKAPAERVVKDIRRAMRKQYSAEDNPDCTGRASRLGRHRQLCWREDIVQSTYYVWSKEFLEAGKRRLAGGTSRAGTTGDVKTCTAKPLP